MQTHFETRLPATRNVLQEAIQHPIQHSLETVASIWNTILIEPFLSGDHSSSSSSTANSTYGSIRSVTAQFIERVGTRKFFSILLISIMLIFIIVSSLILLIRSPFTPLSILNQSIPI